MIKTIVCYEIYKHLFPEPLSSEILWFSEKQLKSPEKTICQIEVLITPPYLVSYELLNCLPSLKWIQLTAAGYEGIDLSELEKRRIRVTTSKGVMSTSIAEDVFCKMFLYARCVFECERLRPEGVWPTLGGHPWMSNVYKDLYGKTLGILGNGSIAGEIAKRAGAFEMNVLVYGRTEKNPDLYDGFYSGLHGLASIAAQADFCVCALPGGEETYHLLNESFFANLKDDCCFINIARGSIVDEDALVNGLRKGKPAFAALDVTETEPLPKSSPLWMLDNVYLTAHKSGAGDIWTKNLASLFLRNIESYKTGKSFENVVL